MTRYVLRDARTGGYVMFRDCAVGYELTSDVRFAATFSTEAEAFAVAVECVPALPIAILGIERRPDLES